MIRNAYSKEPTEKSNFHHPHRLHRGDIDSITHNLSEALHREASHLKEEGKQALHAISSHDSRDERRHRLYEGTNTGEGGLGDFGHFTDSEEEDGDDDRPRSSSSKPPRTHSPEKKKGGIRGWFSKREDRSPSPTDAEEGRAHPGFLSPPLSPTRQTSQPRAIHREENGGDDDNDRSLSRTQSMSVRFASDNQPSSGSAPGNYGNATPGFRKNPALAMYRTTSVQSAKSDTQDLGSPNVSFKEPRIRR